MNINLDIGWRVGLISIVAYCWPIGHLQRNIFQLAGDSYFFPIKVWFKRQRDVQEKFLTCESLDFVGEYEGLVGLSTADGPQNVGDVAMS